MIKKILDDVKKEEPVNPLSLVVPNHDRLLVNNFITELEKAAKPSRKNESDDETKKRILATLNVVNDFVGRNTNNFNKDGYYDKEKKAYSDIEEESEASGLIRHLIEAIDELKYGIVDPILEPNHLNNRPRMPAREWEKRLIEKLIYSSFSRLDPNKKEKMKKLFDLALNDRQIEDRIKNFSKLKKPKSK